MKLSHSGSETLLQHGDVQRDTLYHDEEAIYVEHKGKESGIVRFTFEMIEGLKIVEEEEESADSQG